MNHFLLDSVPGRAGDLTALVAGGLFPLGFAPFGWWPLTLFALAALFAVLHPLPPRRALLRSWLFGVGLFGVGTSWVYVSIHTYGHAPVPVAILVTGLFVALLALFPALLGYFAARLVTRPSPWLPVVVLPAGWVLLDWLRSWLFTGFPWLNLGYSQIDSPLGGFAPVIGVHGVGLAAALSAGLLVALLRYGRRWLSALVLAGLWGIGVLLGHTQWTVPAGEPLKASLIQGNIAQGVKWDRAQRRPTLERYLAMTRAHWDSDVVVWPESAIPALYHQVADGYLAVLEDEARASHTDLLIGLLVYDFVKENYYNSIMSLGSERGFYHKHHLVPFGEYFPIQGWLRDRLEFIDLPNSDFTAGAAKQPLLHVAGHKVASLICYEAAFGEELLPYLPEAELLVNVSNDGWFGDSLAPHQHLEIARMRALETGRYLLRATNTGISAIIDPRGKLLGVTPQFESTVLTGQVEPRAGATPYVRAGNFPVVVAALLLLVAGVAFVNKAGRRIVGSRS